jgi:hypothetical protein
MATPIWLEPLSFGLKKRFRALVMSAIDRWLDCAATSRLRVCVTAWLLMK